MFFLLGLPCTLDNLHGLVFGVSKLIYGTMSSLFYYMIRNMILMRWITLFLGFQYNFIIIHFHNLNFRLGRIHTLVNCIGLIYFRINGMSRIVEKFSTRATTLFDTSFQLHVYTKNYEPPKLQDSQFWEFRDSQVGNPRTK